MLKRHWSHPPNPGAPSRAFHRLSFSHRGLARERRLLAPGLGG
jgi:hypothetical protein